MRIVADSKIPFVQEAFGKFGEVVLLETRLIDRQTVKGADILLVRSETRVDDALLDGSNVRFVGTATIGTDHIDTEYLQKHGIAFAGAPGSNANSVAEYVVAALLVLARRQGFRLRDKVLAVVGVGNIGTKVVRYAEALGMKVLQNDPPLARATGDPRFLPLDELMEADILTLHVPLTRTGLDATYHFFDGSRIGKMRKGSILINTSRGSVVETLAIRNALLRKHLGTCVLDVWEHEPKIDLELLALTALGTPHIAGYSFDGKVNGTKMIYQSVCRHFGYPVTWDVSVSSAVPSEFKIDVAGESARFEQSIEEVVRVCYDIERDDMELRKMVPMPIEQRGAHFRYLRAAYPIRREFYNRKVQVAGESAALCEVLSVLGFQVEHQDR